MVWQKSVCQKPLLHMEPQQYVEWPGSACYCQRPPACRAWQIPKLCCVFGMLPDSEGNHQNSEFCVSELTARVFAFRPRLWCIFLHSSSRTGTIYHRVPPLPYHTPPSPLKPHSGLVTDALSTTVLFGGVPPWHFLHTVLKTLVSDYSLFLFCLTPRAVLFFFSPRTRTFLKQCLLDGALECLLSWAVGMMSW